MTQFHETVGGQRFFNGTVNNLVNALERCAIALEERNRQHEAEVSKVIGDLKQFSDEDLTAFKKFISDTAIKNEWQQKVLGAAEEVNKVKEDLAKHEPSSEESDDNPF